MNQVDPCPPRPGTRVREAMLRFVVALAAVLMFAPAASHAAPGDPVWITPAQPCVAERVQLNFFYCKCNARVTATQRVNVEHERITVSYNPLIQCPVCDPDTAKIDLGQFGSGHHRFVTEVVWQAVGGVDSNSVHTDYYVTEFDVVQECPQGPPPGDAHVQVVPAAPCVDDEVRLRLALCGCSTHLSYDASRLRFLVDFDSRVVCFRCDPETLDVSLGHLAAGHYTFLPSIEWRDAAHPDSSVVTYDQLFADVSPVCRGTVPSLDHVAIGFAPCDSCPAVACAGDSIPVRLSGHFPDGCWSLVKVEAVPSPSASPRPMPDTVRLTYEHACGACTGNPGNVFDARLPIGPLLVGQYGLTVEAVGHDQCADPESLKFLGSETFPFTVQDCPAPGACFSASFARDPSAACDVFLDRDHPAGEVVLLMNAGRPVGGVQGRLVFDKPGLKVTGILAFTTGALLKWEPAADGASFVLVQPSNAPLPAHEPTSLLKVIVALEPGASIDGVVRLDPRDLLVSDVDGAELPQCPDPRLIIIDHAARFCAGVGCDYNADRHADVRDLVLMVRCLTNPPPGVFCAPPPDCDENGSIDLNDVLCCARVILGGTRPDSANAVAAPEVTLDFGAPSVVPGGIDVPVVIAGGARVAGTRLQFTYPVGAFGSASLEVLDQPSNWLALDQDVAGRLTFGGLRLAPALNDGPLHLTLHLRSREGATPSGSVRFESGDFSDGAGAILLTSASPVSMPVAGGGAVELGAARPNPFRGETRFRVTLAQAADVDVAVFDLAGRRVSTLFQGRVAAGTREFLWNRTRDDGSVAVPGVYFYQVVTGGVRRSGKMLVIRGD